MPLPPDPELLKVSNGIVDGFHAVFGKHEGVRASLSLPLSVLRLALMPKVPAHAKGLLLKGTFTPSPLASKLSRAEIFSSSSTPVIIRFSNSTGIPNLPDTEPNANPRGLAVRFNLCASSDGRRRHYDIITHSTPLFPVNNGDDFLTFLQTLKAGGEEVGKFFSTHPAAEAFATEPR